MNNKPRVLILNGSISELPLIEQAKELGYEVFTTGNMPHLIGHPYADGYIPADYSDRDAILALVRRHGIDRVVSCANDFGTITAAFVAEQMGWPGHDSFANTCILHQKDLCKKLLLELGIRTPVSIPFSDAEKAKSYTQTADYPIMVKATDLTGGKGIMRADSPDEAAIAIENAFARSRKKTILIEPFVSGTQQSIDAFVIGGRVAASVSNDVFCPINPYLIQSEVLPAAGIERIEDELHGIIERICSALNLVDGMFTLQYIVSDGKPWVIELMRRCLGNQFLTAAHAVSGFPFEEALVRAETGMDLSGLQWEAPMAKVAGHHGVMAKRNGRLKSYSIDPSVERHVFKSIELIHPGEWIRDYMNERIAYLYYTFDDHEEAVRLAERFNELIHIEFCEENEDQPQLHG